MLFWNKKTWKCTLLSAMILCFLTPSFGAAKKASSKKTHRNVHHDFPQNDTSVVIIDASDPKAFTKAIMLDKEGVKYKIVEKESRQEKAQKQVKITGEKKDEFLDFSNMLIPVTHEAKLGSKFGVRNHRLHRGVDVKVIIGEPIVAALPGVGITSKFNEGGYGHYVLMEHKNGIKTLYGHLSERLVRVGDTLYPGDIVGLAGNTGRSSGAHLHFEIRYENYNIDPETVINFPKWDLQKGAQRISKNEIVKNHRKIQDKLKKERYTVKKGDSLESIAAWFNISVKALCRLNNIDPAHPPKVGQKLKGSE